MSKSSISACKPCTAAHISTSRRSSRRWIADHSAKIVGSVQHIKSDFEADTQRYLRLSRFRELLVEAGYVIDANDRPRK